MNNATYCLQETEPQLGGHEPHIVRYQHYCDPYQNHNKTRKIHRPTFSQPRIDFSTLRLVDEVFSGETRYDAATSCTMLFSAWCRATGVLE